MVTDKLLKNVAAFIAMSSQEMLNRNDDPCYKYDISSRVSVMLTWIDGYDPEDSKTNPYIDSEGYAIEVSLRLRNTDLFWSSWDQIGYGTTLYPHEDGTTPIAKEILEYADELGCLSEPEVLFTLPNGEEVDLLWDSRMVEDDDDLRDERLDLPNLRYLFLGWGDDCPEYKKKIEEWAYHLAGYYGDFDEDLQSMISIDELTNQIFNALIG